MKSSSESSKSRLCWRSSEICLNRSTSGISWSMNVSTTRLSSTTRAARLTRSWSNSTPTTSWLRKTKMGLKWWDSLRMARKGFFTGPRSSCKKKWRQLRMRNCNCSILWTSLSRSCSKARISNWSMSIHCKACNNQGFSFQGLIREILIQHQPCTTWARSSVQFHHRVCTQAM